MHRRFTCKTIVTYKVSKSFKLMNKIDFKKVEVLERLDAAGMRLKKPILLISDQILGMHYLRSLIKY